MTMPKASIDKDTCAVFPQNDVRMARKTLMVESIAEAMMPEVFPNHYLGLSVFAFDSGHIIMDSLWRHS